MTTTAAARTVIHVQRETNQLLAKPVVPPSTAEDRATSPPTGYSVSSASPAPTTYSEGSNPTSCLIEWTATAAEKVTDAADDSDDAAEACAD